MINITLADGYTEKQLMKEVKDRANETDKKITAAVSEIIENVRLNGDKAVKEYTIKFDGKAPEKLEIEREILEDAVGECDADFIEA